MNDVADLVDIAHKLGEKKEIVQGSGGNISIKFWDGSMMIKASGCTFNDVSKDYGLSLVACKTISDYYKNLENTLAEDNDVCADKILVQSKLSAQRPSMEASFHSYLNKAVIHTHPVPLNLIACSLHGEKYAGEMLGDVHFLWVPYTTPGHALAKQIYSQLKPLNGKIPKVIVMQNHGIIVSEDNLHRTFRLHEEIIEKIKNYLTVKNVKLPDWPKTEWENLYGKFWFGKNPLLEKYVNNYETATKFISQHCFPDSVVFLNDIKVFDDFAKAKETKSKINILIGKGFFYQTTLRKARECDEILTAHCMIIENSNYFGGPKFLNKQEVQDILNLDAEKYRQNLK